MILIDYIDGGDLERALPLALEQDQHDRFIELLVIRKERTAEGDKMLEQTGD